MCGLGAVGVREWEAKSGLGPTTDGNRIAFIKKVSHHPRSTIHKRAAAKKSFELPSSNMGDRIRITSRLRMEP